MIRWVGLREVSFRVYLGVMFDVFREKRIIRSLVFIIKVVFRYILGCWDWKEKFVFGLISIWYGGSYKVGFLVVVVIFNLFKYKYM